ncbi:MAG: hypothetical protein P8099_19390, partial [Gemmatimonadota bacterium]
DRGYEGGGYREAMQEAAQVLAGRSGLPNADPIDAAVDYLAAGDTGRALESLEQAYQRHDPNLPYVAAMPMFDAVRGDQRFRDLLRRMGLAESE